MKRVCAKCGLTIFPAQAHVIEVTHAWVNARKQGGANALIDAQYSGRALHWLCYREGEQLGLFDAEP